jgi:hypothetical protein
MERVGLGSLRPVAPGAGGDADWVVAGATGPWTHVGALLPTDFAAYARLLHPAELVCEEVRWETVAAGNGRRAHAGMQWVALTGSWDFQYGNGRGQPELWDESPEVGSLPAATAQRLVAVLQRFTGTDDCFYAVWEGFGDLVVAPATVATIAMPGRTMLLFRGLLANAATATMESPPFGRSPSLWWPADRAWCVATDVDLNYTYIGATDPCIEAVLADPTLESWRVAADDRIDVESDTLNPIPPVRSFPY